MLRKEEESCPEELLGNWETGERRRWWRHRTKGRKTSHRCEENRETRKRVKTNHKEEGTDHKEKRTGQEEKGGKGNRMWEEDHEVETKMEEDHKEEGMNHEGMRTNHKGRGICHKKKRTCHQEKRTSQEKKQIQTKNHEESMKKICGAKRKNWTRPRAKVEEQKKHRYPLKRAQKKGPLSRRRRQDRSQ